MTGNQQSFLETGWIEQRAECMVEPAGSTKHASGDEINETIEAII